jgi:16S rRNA (uracil1498-N3)-methyltransferase
MFRFHVPGAHEPAVDLPADEAQHLTRVLRLIVGDEVVIFDGTGGEWLGRVARAARGAVRVDLLAARDPVPEPAVHVTLGVGLLKGDQMAAVIRDATMLGVAAIAPIATAHVTLPAPAWARQPLDRWTRIAIASAKQCGRAVVPAILPVTRLPDLLAGPEDETRILCVEPVWPDSITAPAIPARPRAVLCVGPEGGWTEEEVALARSRGAYLLGLGPRRLRAETAPTVALAALWTVWGEGPRRPEAR